MQNIQELLSDATHNLQEVSDSAELDAEVLLCHVLKKNRSYLRTWPERYLDNKQYKQFHSLLSQRLQGQPIAYIVGQREFWSRNFQVTDAVLIPRPDTETIIELCLHLIQDKPNAKLIDLGTGSGIIAITLAAEFPKLQVTAVDNSTKALNIAQKNAKLNKTPHIKFLQSNWLQQIPQSHFDLIVSNPPYICPDDPHLTQGDVRFEPSNALISEQQGLQDIIQICAQSRHYLNHGGHLILEHGYQQKIQVHSILQEYGYQNIHCQQDLANQPRVSYAQQPTSF